MLPQTSVDLSLRNTLRLSARAEYHAVFSDTPELLELAAWAQQRALPIRMLGGGSNVRLAPQVSGLVLQSGMSAIHRLGVSGHFCRVRVEAGKTWHDWVEESIHYGHGLENLALIPGTVGAAPIQNIGAYGVEVGEFIDEVQGYQLSTGQLRRFSAQECRFGYRDSVFKRELAGDFVITAVVFRLEKQFNPRLQYGPLADLQKQDEVSPRQLIDRVVAIRRQRLPDPAVTPNAGSWFKNPVIPASQCQQLQQTWPELPVYPALTPGFSKLAAAWLIDQCGWKGRWLGNAGMHSEQALVLVTNGQASLKDIDALQGSVMADVFAKFGVRLEPEPVLMGN